MPGRRKRQTKHPEEHTFLAIKVDHYEAGGYAHRAIGVIIGDTMAVYVSSHEVSRSHLEIGGNWTLKDLTDVTVLMGKNGAGKSVLLRAWREQAPEDVHYIVPERTGEMNYRANLIQQEEEGASRRGYSHRNFVPDYRSRVIGRVQTFLMKRGNVRDKAVPACDPRELEMLLDTLLPEFSVQLKTTGSIYYCDPT